MPSIKVLKNGQFVTAKGVRGLKGEKGNDGNDGIGVPVGGTTGQHLLKNSDTDYDFAWGTPSAPSSGDSSWSTANHYPKRPAAPVKSYSLTSFPAQNGSVSATSVAVCRFSLHGVGFEAATEIASVKATATVKCLNMLCTTEFEIFKNGNNYRVDYQSYLYGSSDATDYYAISRGSLILPQGTLGSPGYLAWVNSTSSNGRHNHMAVNNGHIGPGGDPLPDNNNPSNTVEPIYFNGIPYYGRTDDTDTAQTIWQLAIDGSHSHSVTAAYKINSATGHNSAVDNHAEIGNAVSPKITPQWYADGTTLVSTYYTQYTAANYLELRINNIPAQTGYSPLVETVLTVEGSNHKLWSYDCEMAAWESAPVVGALGDSIVEAVDLSDKLYFNTTQAPYGSTYRFIWTEKRGYWNYGVGGQTTDAIKARIRLTGTDIEMMSTGSWYDKNFTHIIINGGINDCIREVLRAAGKKLAGDTYDHTTWVYQPKQNIADIVTLVRSATARTIQPIILISPQIAASVYYNKSGSTLPVVDFSGASVGYTSLADWQNIAAAWDVVAKELYDYAYTEGLPVINWYELSKKVNWKTVAGSYTYDGLHPNIRGYLYLADYADIS